MLLLLLLACNGVLWLTGTSSESTPLTQFKLHQYLEWGSKNSMQRSWQAKSNGEKTRGEERMADQQLMSTTVPEHQCISGIDPFSLLNR